MKKIFLILVSVVIFAKANAQNNADQILGKWMSAENDLKVEVFKENGQFRAKVIWFACLAGHTMSEFYDTENPNAALRNRPWLGLQVLNNLSFDGKTEWKNGSIYDPNSGHTFSSVCRLKNANTLTVRGFWMYEWIGKNMTFYKAEESQNVEVKM
jgi:uncharacterized protein (DUF2147 family)